MFPPRSSIRAQRTLAALAVAVFALALVPRLWRIDAHLTPDELRWVCRTVGFHTGLRTGDLALTLQTGHPGVITMWLGGIGLPVAPGALPHVDVRASTGLTTLVPPAHSSPTA